MGNLNQNINRFLRKTKLNNYDILPIVGDASDRKYYRLRRGSNSLILMDTSKTIETLKSYLSVGKYLANNKFSVPEIFDVDLENGYVILEDFGNTLDIYLPNNSKDLKNIYYSAVNLIIALSTLKVPPFAEFDKQFFLKELSIFSNWYVPYLDRTFGKEKLDEFEACWNKPLKYLSINDKNHVFVHKDMHCGNLFWLPKRSGVRNLGIIDFQNAKSGSGVYDITSLLYDCRFSIPQSLRNNLLKKYLLSKGWDIENFKTLCDIYIAQRNIKILGNFLQIYRQKDNASYLKFLPSVRSFIQKSLDHPILKDVKVWFAKNNIGLIGNIT